MQEINGALFLNAKGLFFLSLISLDRSVALTVIVPLTTIYASLLFLVYFPFVFHLHLIAFLLGL